MLVFVALNPVLLALAVMVMFAVPPFRLYLQVPGSFNVKLNGIEEVVYEMFWGLTIVTRGSFVSIPNPLVVEEFRFPLVSLQ